MSSVCEGCNYHDFPYKATLPIKSSGGYPIQQFNSLEDVKAMIPSLVNEAIEYGCPDVNYAVYNQLGSFSCTSLFLDAQSQKDIKKYLFCKDFNIPPSSGSYEEQQNKTIQKFTIIKSAISKLEEMQQKKMERERAK